jgi:diaminohydroxyphosphoribosylaminopyrimidine deaminase/5-amino-6-(5-phosphoribosylamino)uracil reductase
VIADDPMMNVRIEGSRFQPLRVVLDSHGRMPAGARIMNPPGRVLVVGVEGSRSSNAESMVLSGAGGRVDLASLLRELAARQCNEVLIEAGRTLSGAFAAAGLVDEYIFYLAPRLLGTDARGMFDLGRSVPLADSLELEIVDIARLDTDLRILARPKTKSAK